MVAEPLEKKSSTVEFRPGDTVRVHIKVVEGDSERIQMFEGTVISRRGSGASQTFTVRKISFGVGVERTFPLFSPHIDKIEVMKSGRVRRARLYYLKNLSGRAARLAESETRQPKEAPPAAAEGGAAPAEPSPEGPQADAKDAAHKQSQAGDSVKKQTNHASGAARAIGAATPQP